MANAASAGADFPSRRSRSSHRKRYLLVALGLVVLVGALAALKGAQIASLIAFGKKAKAAGPPPETVGAAAAESQEWNETLESVGSVTSARGVTISNDAPGIVSRLSFESGATVQKGQILAELDTKVERAQLAAARARLALAKTNAARTRTLAAEGSIAPAQKDTDETQLAASAADERALTAQIERKVVRAPFDGKLGIRLVNVGQYLGPGTPITLLESAEATYVDFALPQQELGRVAVDMPVDMTFGKDQPAGAPVPPPVEGKVFAVEPAVDPTTRNIKVRASVPPERNDLRPGMFVNVSVILPKKTTVIAVPATAVVHASYGDSVFVVEDGQVKGEDGKPSKVVRQQFVRLGERRGDFVAVTVGLKAKEQVVTAGAFKLRNKAPIVVNNAVGTHPELSPNPPNR